MTIFMKKVVNDKVTVLTHDFIGQHEYEVRVRAIGPDGTNEAIEHSPCNTITIQGKLTAPDTPVVFSATGHIEAILLSWANPPDYDFDYMEVWRSNTSSRDSISLTKLDHVSGTTYLDVIGSPNVKRYYWIRAVNTSGVTSSYNPLVASDVSATTLGVVTTDISDFAITATKMFNKTIILTDDAWTNNSPGAGFIAWNTHSIVYNGATYPITAGDTSSAYVYWIIGSTTYSTSATHPSLGVTGFMVVVNTSGTHTLVWNSSANMVIGNAFIVDLNADKITAGTITGSTLQTAASGQRVVIASSDNTLKFYNAAGTNVVIIDDNVSVGRPGMRIGHATDGGVIDVRKDSTHYCYMHDDQIACHYAEDSTGIWVTNHSTGASGSLVRIVGDFATSGTATGNLILAITGTSPSTEKFKVDFSGNIDNAGYMDAVTYKVNGAAGANFNGAVTNITVVDGLVTAVS